MVASFSDGGGGGERVLWTMINCLLDERPDTDIFLYTGYSITPAELLDLVKVLIRPLPRHNCTSNFFRINLELKSKSIHD